MSATQQEHPSRNSGSHPRSRHGRDHGVADEHRVAPLAGVAAVPDDGLGGQDTLA